MQFHVVLNMEGGTLRGRDPDALAASLARVLEEAGHTAAVFAVGGAEVGSALDAAAAGEADAVMAGGGDGTVSAAAARLAGGDKALAVLPAGTMNLFARSLAIPPDPDAAAAAFATGRVRSVDVAEADGRIFVHQFSVGLHTKLIRLRERSRFGSRQGKMLASLRAGLAAFLRPPRLAAALSIDGREFMVRASGISVTCNLLGEGRQLPYAERPDGGVLGIYVTRARRRRDLARLALGALLGRWRRNAAVDVYSAREVELRLLAHHRRFGCAMDGELAELATVTRLRIRPGALKVLVPGKAE
jgi:diacylglycerol kinase family enzyme